MLNSDKFFKIKADPSFNPENVDKESFIFENSREHIGYARQLEMLYDKIDAFFAAQPESSYCLNFNELTTLLISWYGLKGKDPIMFNTVLGLFGLSLNEAMDIDDEYVDQVRESSMNILIQKKMGILEEDEQSFASESGSKENSQTPSFTPHHPRALAYVAYMITQSPNFHELLRYIAADGRFTLLYHQKREGLRNRNKTQTQPQTNDPVQ